MSDEALMSEAAALQPRPTSWRSPEQRHAVDTAQLGIVGVPPVHEPLTNLVILGRLAARPRLLVSTDGRPHLSIEIRQARAMLPIATCYHGTSEQHAMLEELAMRWTPGTMVIVRGAGIALEPADGDELRPFEPAAPAGWRLRVVECRVPPWEVAFDDSREASLV